MTELENTVIGKSSIPALIITVILMVAIPVIFFAYAVDLGLHSHAPESENFIRDGVVAKHQLIASGCIARQKANFAVRMYEAVGFETVDENDEEFIMVCEI